MNRRMTPFALLTSIVALAMLLVTDSTNAARKRPQRKQAGRTAKKRTPKQTRRKRTTAGLAKKRPRRTLGGKNAKSTGRFQTPRTGGAIVRKGLKGKSPNRFSSNHPTGAQVQLPNRQVRASSFIPFFGPAGLLLPAVQKSVDRNGTNKLLLPAVQKVRPEKPKGLLPAVQKSKSK